MEEISPPCEEVTFTHKVETLPIREKISLHEEGEGDDL